MAGRRGNRTGPRLRRRGRPGTRWPTCRWDSRQRGCRSSRRCGVGGFASRWRGSRILKPDRPAVTAGAEDVIAVRPARRARGAVSSYRLTAAVLAIVTVCAAGGIFLGLTSTVEATAPATPTLLAAPVQSPSEATVTGVSVTGQPSGSSSASSSTLKAYLRPDLPRPRPRARCLGRRRQRLPHHRRSPHRQLRPRSPRAAPQRPPRRVRRLRR